MDKVKAKEERPIVGRRKTSVARLYYRKGKGEFDVNGHPLADYFRFPLWQKVVMQPLDLLSVDKNYAVRVSVDGGGVKGQAEAIRLALAKAICREDEGHKKALRAEGFLTRDSRKVERKKYGRRKARRRFQFSKR